MRKSLFITLGILALVSSPRVVAAQDQSSRRVMAKEQPESKDPIVLLLTGIYHPVVNGPDLGLPGVDLNDGTWHTTEIHSTGRVPGSSNEHKVDIGNFYVGNGKAVYDLPGGAILMQFTAGSFSENPPIPDGQGGKFLEETFELTILDATGIYSPYVGGHNHRWIGFMPWLTGSPMKAASALSVCQAVCRFGGPPIRTGQSNR
jgi:hypothetical protein